MVSNEMFWNKMNAIHDEVHSNSIKIAVVETKLTNHLEHQDKKTNVKLTFFGIIMAVVVGLSAIFI